MLSILHVIAALLRSHGRQVGRHAKAMALYGVLIAGFALTASLYLVILGTYLLSGWLGTGWALALIAGLALVGCLVAGVLLRAEKRRLVAAHREHVEQERLALKAAGVEALAAGKLSGSLAAVSASVAALIVILLRRLGPEAEPEGAGEPPSAPKSKAGADAGP